MPLPSLRLTFLIIFLGCCGLMGTGFYLQYVEDLYPCNLCLTQRLFIVLVGLTGLIAFIFNARRTGRVVAAVFGGLFAIIGGSVSSRQIWLQSLPEDQVPACGPDFAYLFDSFPFLEAVAVMFRGDGNCAEVVWTLFGISIPGWTLVAFIGLLLINVWQGFRRPQN